MSANAESEAQGGSYLLGGRKGLLEVILVESVGTIAGVQSWRQRVIQYSNTAYDTTCKYLICAQKTTGSQLSLHTEQVQTNHQQPSYCKLNCLKAISQNHITLFTIHPSVNLSIILFRATRPIKNNKTITTKNKKTEDSTEKEKNAAKSNYNENKSYVLKFILHEALLPKNYYTYNNVLHPIP